MATLTDELLVERILDGDSGALGQLYDRYADRIHSMCAHMLRDDDAALDVTSEVFLTAAERLGQLRDPSKVKSWLYAIARNEVYRRTRHRRREVTLSSVGGVGLDAAALDADDLASWDGSGAVGGAAAPFAAPDDEVGLEPRASQEDLAALLQDASAGLDDRDRMVLELHLAQGLDGQELADALGVSRDHGYQLVHRMKERLEAATSALLIARSGRSVCDGLDEVADSWDGAFNVLWRKRFARHIGRCERCSSLRGRVSKAVLSGTALALAAQSTVLAAPISARERVLAEAPARLGVPRGGRWRADGFPPHRPRRRRALVGGVVAVVLVLLVSLGTASILGGADVEEVRSAAPSGGSSAPAREQGVPTTVPTTAALLPGPVQPPAAGAPALVPPAPTTTSAVSPAGGATSTTTPSVSPAPAPAPAPAPPPPPPVPVESTTTTTTQPPDSQGPSLSLSAPSCVSWGYSGTATASASDPSGVSSVSLSWTGAVSGSKSSGGSSISATVVFPQPATSVTFTASATDAAGNSSSTSRTVAGSPSC